MTIPNCTPNHPSPVKRAWHLTDQSSIRQRRLPNLPA